MRPPIYDIRLAAQAQIMDEMIRLGGVVIDPQPPTGFQAPKPRPVPATPWRMD